MRLRQDSQFKAFWADDVNVVMKLTPTRATNREQRRLMRAIPDDYDQVYYAKHQGGGTYGRAASQTQG